MKIESEGINGGFKSRMRKKKLKNNSLDILKD